MKGRSHSPGANLWVIIRIQTFGCISPLNWPIFSVTKFVWLFATLWTKACQDCLSFTVSWNLLKLMSIELVMKVNHLILCYPLLLPSKFPSIRVFSNDSVLPIWWLKFWSFSFSISPSSDYSGLISFRVHWFDFLTVQGTLKNLLQHHNSKAASILWHWIFFKIQLLHLYMTTGFVSKGMPLLFFFFFNNLNSVY